MNFLKSAFMDFIMLIINYTSNQVLSCKYAVQLQITIKSVEGMKKSAEETGIITEMMHNRRIMN